MRMDHKKTAELIDYSHALKCLGKAIRKHGIPCASNANYDQKLKSLYGLITNITRTISNNIRIKIYNKKEFNKKLINHDDLIVVMKKSSLYLAIYWKGSRYICVQPCVGTWN